MNFYTNHVHSNNIKRIDESIKVGDYNGRGESCPTPYFYQNLGEAEWVLISQRCTSWFTDYQVFFFAVFVLLTTHIPHFAFSMYRWMHQSIHELIHESIVRSMVVRYVVALYSYMRLVGYPADRISILTTYNGQKHLIRDVLQQRCTPHPALGMPARVTTVDK